MHHHLGRKFTLIVAAFFLVMGAASVQDASAASASATCKKENCTSPKKSCLSTFKAEFNAAKAACKAAKIDGMSNCGKDKECKKGVKLAFQECKKAASETNKENTSACKTGFESCNVCCKNGMPDCDIKTCGDDVPVPGEDCDDGGESATCDADCTPAACGDGTKNVTAGEECDDGNTKDGDGVRDFCDSNCTVTSCGNGIVTKGEFCDLGENSGGPSPDCGAGQVCNQTCECVAACECGNGLIQPRCGEQCDPPGNLAPTCEQGERCGETCQCEEIPCGNGITEPGEECDPPGSEDECGLDEVCNSSCQCELCPCCALGATYLESTVVVASGVCGSLRNFRCSNASSAACKPGDNSDCDFGTCFITPPFCSGNFSVSCTSNAQCQGTCNESVAGNLPLDLKCGGLYTGGGLNSVPLPFAIPDKNKMTAKITSCQGNNMVLGPATKAEVGELACSEGRKCSDNAAPCVLDGDCTSGDCQDRCLFGAPLPVPNPGTPATSVCTVNVVAEDASGTGSCLGDSDVTAPLRSVIYLNGDLFKSSTPPDLPGAQPCPLCVPICQGGSKDGLPCRSDNPFRACAGGTAVGKPCTADGQCPSSTCAPARQELTDCINGGGTCPSESECLGGPNNASPCTPGTSDSSVLGDAQDAFPTSHDCGNDPSQDITKNIGGLPIDFAITTGTLTADMPQTAVDRPNGLRVFCGFCRDEAGQGSKCFKGDTKSCPTANPPADGSAVACLSDAECAAAGDEYESCVQRNPGAFSEAGATSITMQGEPAGCLADGTPKRGTTVGTFCVPPTFDATVDAAGDLPGPGAVSLQGDVKMRQ